MQIMQSASSRISKIYLLIMEDLVTKEWVPWSVTTSTKISCLSSQSSILLSLMDIQDRYISQIGFPCFIMHCGQVGIVCLHIFLKEMQMIPKETNLLSSTLKFTRLVKSINISHLKSFGNGLYWLFGTDLWPFLAPSWPLIVLQLQMGTSRVTGSSRLYHLL